MPFGLSAHLKWPYEVAVEGAQMPSRPELPVLALTIVCCLPPLQTTLVVHIFISGKKCSLHVCSSCSGLDGYENPSLDLGLFSFDHQKYLEPTNPNANTFEKLHISK